MKKTLKILLCILAAAAVISLAAGFAVYYIVISASSGKDIVFSADQNQMDISEDDIDDLEKVEVEYTECEIQSYDGLKLHAWQIEGNEDVFVIGVHGYTDNGKVAGSCCGGFYSRGYSILLPDLRGQGESEGDYIGFGWDDRLDILEWIEYINEKYDSPDIILYGLSMGASCVLMTSGEEFPSNVRCIISDSAYTSVKDEFTYEAKTLLHLPYFPVVASADLFTRIFAGYSFGEADAVSQVKKSETPTLFIHGSDDEFVPPDNMYTLYDACSAPKEYRVFEGAQHCMSQFENFEEYWNCIFSFTDKYVKGQK